MKKENPWSWLGAGRGVKLPDAAHGGRPGMFEEGSAQCFCGYSGREREHRFEILSDLLNHFRSVGTLIEDEDVKPGPKKQNKDLQ